MNVEKLKDYVGRELKYKELCEILEIKSATGNTKIKQIKELGTLVEFEKRGTKYMILKIYQEQLEKIDGRADGNNNKFGYDLEITLMYLLQDKKTLKISVNKALQLTHLVNANYSAGRRDIPLASSVLEVEKGYLYTFYDSHHRDIRNTFERTLKKLRGRALVMADIVTFVCKDKVDIQYNESGEPLVERGKIKYQVKEIYNIATEDEKKTILRAEKDVLKSMGHTSHQGVFLSGRWKEFKSEVEKIIQKQANIKYYFDGYHITINEEGIKYDIEKYEMETARISTNDKIVSSVKKSIKTQHSKHEWSNDVRGNADYPEIANKLVDTLVNTDCTMNLSKEMSKAKKSKSKATQEQADIKDEGVPF